MSEPLIQTRGLTKRYGTRTAVRGLDLDVHAGEIFGLLGQNGAGKTTTILMLLGLTEASAGTARVAGLDPARQPLEVKRRVGYLPDSVGFYGDRTGRENLRYTARLNGLGGAPAESVIEAVLEQVGLTDRADTRTDTYSKGMLQRLGIADALVKTPDVLILDEPTTGIDPIGVTEILDLLRRLVRERGVAVLLSSHQLDQVQAVCDRIGIFVGGRLIHQGRLDELAAQIGDDTGRIEASFEYADEREADRADGALRSLDAVTDVARPERPELPWTVTVSPRAAAAGVRQAILAASARLGLHLTSLHSLIPSLSEIYGRAASQVVESEPEPEPEQDMRLTQVG